jgi:hypothetical protein
MAQRSHWFVIMNRPSALQGFAVLATMVSALSTFACSGEPGAESGPVTEPGAPSGPTSSADEIAPIASLDPPDAACGGVVVQVKRVPLAFVVAFDRSASMGLNGKWDAASSGMSAFFESAQSDVTASLTFFPKLAHSCAGDFAAPEVPATALPSALFRAEFAKTSLLGGTPTRPALEGALASARALKNAALGGGRVVIGLVSDGAPSKNLCANDGVEDVVGVAKQGALEGILTYAIGMPGANRGNMDAIADGGGTKAATILDPTDPAKQLTSTFDAIRNQFACDVSLPASPDGQVRYDEVNVMLGIDGAAAAPLAYSSDCANVSGWRYDDPTHPSRLELCETSCAAVRAGGGVVDVKLGCPTVGGIR